MSHPLTRRHNRLTKRELAGVERVMALDGDALKDFAFMESQALAAAEKRTEAIRAGRLLPWIRAAIEARAK